MLTTQELASFQDRLLDNLSLNYIKLVSA